MRCEMTYELEGNGAFDGLLCIYSLALALLGRFVYEGIITLHDCRAACLDAYLPKNLKHLPHICHVLAK